MYTPLIINFYLCITHIYPRFNNRFYLLPSFLCFTWHCSPTCYTDTIYISLLPLQLCLTLLALKLHFCTKQIRFLAQQLVVPVIEKRIFFFTPYCNFILLSDSCCKSSLFRFHSLCTLKHYKINTHSKQNQIVLSLLLIPTPCINQFPRKKK